MFFIPRVNVIASDAGFSVEVLGRTGMRYREGDKSLFIDSEVLVSGRGIAIAADSIKRWDPPNGGEVIGASKKFEIINNVREALAFRNEPLQVL